MKLNDLNASYCKLSTSNHIQQTNSNEKNISQPPTQNTQNPSYLCVGRSDLLWCVFSICSFFSPVAFEAQLCSS